MADLSITASEVVQSTSSNDISHGTSGQAVAIGDSVYKKAADGKIWNADADAAASAAAVGIAISTASAADQGISYQFSGTLTVGATASVTAGATYWVSTNVGKIAVEGDLTTGDYVTYLGTANASDQIVMPSGGPVASGVAHA